MTTVQPANQKLLDQLLCIVSSANPNIGEVYPGETAVRYRKSFRPLAKGQGRRTAKDSLWEGVEA